MTRDSDEGQHRWFCVKTNAPKGQRIRAQGWRHKATPTLGFDILPFEGISFETSPGGCPLFIICNHPVAAVRINIPEIAGTKPHVSQDAMGYF
jgi:hypothetical protein